MDRSTTRAGDDIQSISSPRSYGTKFCLVAVPSPKMEKPGRNHAAEDDLYLKASRDTGELKDSRLRHPAAYSHGEDKVDNKTTPNKLDALLDTLRNDLKSLQQQDQVILRQFLTIYQTISDLHYGDMQPPLTPPPEREQVFQYQGCDALSPAIMADEVRDLVSYQGQLNIRDVVSRLSPIKRQRTSSEPFLDVVDDDSLSLDNSTEDLLSLSSPFI